MVVVGVVGMVDDEGVVGEVGEVGVAGVACWVWRNEVASTVWCAWWNDVLWVITSPLFPPEPDLLEGRRPLLIGGTFT